MRTVKIRHGHKIIDGKIIYDETNLTYKKAEKLVSVTLDRRINYMFINRELCILGQWTSPCSGCSPDDPYWCGERGGGCSECGGQGKVRQGHWLPVTDKGKIVKMKKDSPVLQRVN